MGVLSVDLQVDGNPVYPFTINLVQSLCDSLDTLQFQVTDNAVGAVNPYAPVVLNLSGFTYRGYVKKTETSMPPGYVTVMCEDEMTKAADHFETGSLIDGIYFPIFASPVQDVADWYNFWCDRIGLQYNPATNPTGRVVPETYSWQYITGTEIFRQLVGFAGSGFQVKTDSTGTVNLISYANVPKTGELPVPYYQKRTVSDAWTRNEVIVYYGSGTVDLINPGAAVPPALFPKRSIISSPYLTDVGLATNIAASILNFYSGYMDVWEMNVAEEGLVYSPGVNLGGKLLVSNTTHIAQGAGMVQALIFDRFCPNAWGLGTTPSLEDMLRNAYPSTLVYHALESTGSGLSPFVVAPQQQSYEVLGVYCWTKEPNTPVFAAIYENGAAVPGTGKVLVSTASEGMFVFYNNITLLAGHVYKLYVSAADMRGVRVAWKYRRYTAP